MVFRKPEELRPGVMIDCSYAPGKYDRKSVSGAIFTLGGMTVFYFSQTQPIVCISTAEAEYVVFTPAVQEVLFQLMLLDEWGVGERPAFIMEDNTAAIYLVRNQTSGKRTKHISIRFHFIRQHFPDDFVPIYVESKSNDSDQMTKNQPVEMYIEQANNISNGNTFIKRNWWKIAKSVEDGSYFNNSGRMS
jgi:hypothetical protein